jgi:Mrp family chromosome partitioning ATPase
LKEPDQPSKAKTSLKPAKTSVQSEILAQSPTLQRVCDGPGAAAATGPPMATEADVEPPCAVTLRGRLPFPRSLHAPASLPFVGRAVELARLREHWTGLGGETRSVVILGGEPGIGKTRLTGELARAVHQEGGLVLYGRCDEGLAVPYQPFVEALRPYATAAGADGVRAGLCDLASELGRLLPELGGLGVPIRSDPESDRFALF